MGILIGKTAIFVQILCLIDTYMGVMRHFFHFTLALALILGIASCSEKDRYISISGYAQGGTYTVKLNLQGKDGRIKVKPEEIRDSIASILSAIDNSVSGYNRNSLLSRFNAGEAVVPDSIFADLYRHAFRFYEETGGIVDAASAPLFDIWGFGFRSGDFPTDEKVEAIRKNCGMRRLLPYDAAGHGQDGSIDGFRMLRCAKGAVEGTPVLPQLNYNAIAQGYSCDLVAGYLHSIGVKDMMVDIGEIFCDGLNPSGQPWSLGIDKPVDGNNELGAQMQGIFRVPEGPHGIVTSGNYRKFYIRDGKKYAHSIDPRTGSPVSHNLLSATIVADDAITADAYATYCMVAGLDQAKELLESRQDLEGCLIYDEDGTFMTWCSDGFVLEGL